MHQNMVTRIEVVFLLLIFLGLAWTGCSTLNERPREPVKGQDVGVGKYYHFEDVLIPRELSYDPSESFVYEAAQFKTGSMIFKKWRIDLVTLIDYFLDHMEKDNWKLVNSFQGRETILNFTKPDKTCTIKITERWYGTAVVEVRVGPIEMKKM